MLIPPLENHLQKYPHCEKNCEKIQRLFIRELFFAGFFISSLNSDLISCTHDIQMYLIVYLGVKTMASMKFHNDCKRWRVFWHVTLSDGSIDKGSKSFSNKTTAPRFKEHCENLLFRFFNPVRRRQVE
jgi:hypothetical protein